MIEPQIAIRQAISGDCDYIDDIDAAVIGDNRRAERIAAQGRPARRNVPGTAGILAGPRLPVVPGSTLKREHSRVYLEYNDSGSGVEIVVKG